MAADTGEIVHPENLAEHLAYAHGLGSNVLLVTDRAVLEMAHTQRHDGFGVGADHPRDHSHEQTWVQVTAAQFGSKGPDQ